MKVLHITSSFPRSKNDIQGTFLLELVRKLAENGIDNTVLAPDCSLQEDNINYGFKTRFYQYLPKRYEKLPNGPLTHLSKSRLFELPWYSIATIINYLALSDDYDVVHAHWAIPMGFLVSFGQSLKFHKKKPFIITCHGQDIGFALEKRIYRFPVLTSLRKTDQITCDATHLAEKIIKLGIPSRKVKTLYLGVDPEFFNPNHYKNGRKNFGLEEGIPTIGSLSSLLPNKRIDLLLKAFRIVNRKIDSQLVICGKGPLYYQLVSLSEKLGIKSAVKFLGAIERHQIPLYLSALDVFALPSLKEGLSIALQESMAMENAPVVSNTVEAHDLIEDGVNGLYALCSNSDLFSNVIVKAIENSSILGKKARKTIVEKFNINNTSKELIECYEKMV
ncbi:MAG: glycosyltransferase family 4 protein [Candidatus Odinarchaeota archaeon]